MATQPGTFRQTGTNEINMDEINREYARNEFAVGVITFAAIMMIMVGGFHAIAGIAEIINDDLFVIPRDYVYELDVTAWGWIHLVTGVIFVVVGISLFTGTVLARAVGIIAASLSLIINFIFLPAYPFWSGLIIAIDIILIWALVTRGGAMAARDFR